MKPQQERSTHNSSPIYHFLQQVDRGKIITELSVRNKLNCKTTAKKPNKPVKHYVQIGLPKYREIILIFEELCVIRDNHISVYQTAQDKGRFGMTTYHYTASVQYDGAPGVLHAYYDVNGNYHGCQLKRKVEQSWEVVEVDDFVFRALSGKHIIPVINDVMYAHETYVASLENDVEKVANSVVHLSRSVFPRDQKPVFKGSCFRDYMFGMRDYKSKVNRLNLFSFEPQDGVARFLAQAIDSIQQQAEGSRDTSKAESNKKVSGSTSKQKSSGPTKKIQQKKLDIKEQQSEPELQRLKQLLQKIETLESDKKTMENILTLHQSVEEAFQLTSGDDFSTLIRLYQLQNEIPKFAQRAIEIYAGASRVAEIEKLYKFAGAITRKAVTMAAKFASADCLRTLLKRYKGSVNIYTGLLPLLCDESVKAENCRVLLERGANPNVLDIMGDSALTNAAIKVKQKK